jgi:LCP family protein required for cell wall assembly
MRRFFKRDPDPFAASRFEGVFRSVRTRERKHMRHWWQWALLGFLVLFIGFMGFATYKYYAAQGEMQDPDIPTVPVEDETTDPFVVLLVGSDSREGLSEEEQLELGANPVGGERADTLILARVDPAANQIIMAQFPRDLYVPILDEGEDRINTALDQGPGHLVRAVNELTGIEINKYVQVNIAGFRQLVDAIGGVDVCITEPVPFDDNTGIEITEDELGMVHFDGDRAIRFVRSRNFTTGDFQRIQNQQKFLSAAIDKVLSAGTLLRPTRILDLLDIAGDNVKTDVHTTINGLRSLAGRFRSFDPEHYEAYTVPNFGVANVDGASVVAPDFDTMEILFEAIRRGESPAEFDGVPDIAPSTIRVGVYNGAYKRKIIEGLALDAKEKLMTATDIGDGPVRVVEVANAGRGNYEQTTIRHTAETEQMAQLVAAALPGAIVEEVNETPEGTDVEVIVARPVQAQKIVQILPIPIPPPSDPPKECR